MSKAGRELASRDWWRASAIRALKTFAQTAIALIGTTVVGVTDVDWAGVASGAALAAVLSLLTSLAGLPELPDAVPPAP